MPPHWNKNRLTAILGIDYPVIQGPLGGLSSQKLTAAVSNFGGLGSFAAHSMTPGAIKDVIAEIRSLTSKPFAMNLWVSMEDEGARTADENGFNRSLAPLVADVFRRCALWSERHLYLSVGPLPVQRNSEYRSMHAFRRRLTQSRVNPEPFSAPCSFYDRPTLLLPPSAVTAFVRSECFVWSSVVERIAEGCQVVKRPFLRSPSRS